MSALGRKRPFFAFAAFHAPGKEKPRQGKRDAWVMGTLAVSKWVSRVIFKNCYTQPENGGWEKFDQII
jgi:hypothetical protein